jgi:hypothetical protein
MAWIKTIGLLDPDLTPELATAYQEVFAQSPPEYRGGGDDGGGPPRRDAGGIVKSHSLDPVALRTAFAAGMHLIGGPSPLSRREREMINTVVSAANRCFY